MWMFLSFIQEDPTWDRNENPDEDKMMGFVMSGYVIEILVPKLMDFNTKGIFTQEPSPYWILVR